jgi:hypothetical protein
MRAPRVADQNRDDSKGLALTAPNTESPDPTMRLPWARRPPGWIAGAATVLAIVAVAVMLGWLG